MASKRKMSDYRMGLTISLGAGLGVVAGALLDNIALWLCVGAGIGVLLGACMQLRKKD